MPAYNKTVLLLGLIYITIWSPLYYTACRVVTFEDASSKSGSCQCKAYKKERTFLACSMTLCHWLSTMPWLLQTWDGQFFFFRISKLREAELMILKLLLNF